MGLSALLAFGVPAKYARRFSPQIQMVFAPVSRPVAVVAGWINNRVAPPAVADRRAVQDIRQENQQLHVQVNWLVTQLEELSRREQERSQLGDVKGSCRFVKVIGGDAGSRQSIFLAGSTLAGIRDEMYVLYPGGLVGQVDGAGAMGVQVRLLSDPAFKVRIEFRRFDPQKGQSDKLQIPLVVAQGDGRDGLMVRGLSLAEIGYDAQGRADPHGIRLEETDFAVVADTDCPSLLQGETVGRVVGIARRRSAPLMAEVRIAPATNLKKLSEVWVMVKEN